MGGGDDMEELVKRLLKEHGEIASSSDLAVQHNLDAAALIGVLKSLADPSRRVVSLTLEVVSVVRLLAEGEEILKCGMTPELRLFKDVLEAGQEGLSLAECKKRPLALAAAVRKGTEWLRIDKSRQRVVVTNAGVKPVDEVFLQLLLISETVKANGRCTTKYFIEEFDAKTLQGLAKRRMLRVVDDKSFKVLKGECFDMKSMRFVADLTEDLLANDRWKQTAFKEYNLVARGLAAPCGALHPLLKMREQYRSIFFDLGFEEMDTDRWVESSFWNFDALFQPQQHPARDMHDTFFVSEPELTVDIPVDYQNKVAQIHSVGGFGSVGYQYTWKEAEARKNLLRTHTTAVSSRVLYHMAQEGVFRPRRFFSIDRVFRNEMVDVTHLAEFHQVEGFIVDKGLTLRHLMGIIKLFFEKIGLTSLRFKPAYNPYTEPSMEIFAYHPLLKRDVEIGNSGMFRPEMLRPMGFDEDVRVAAWGLSLERPTMILFGVKDIRELVGFRADVVKQRNNPIACVGE